MKFYYINPKVIMETSKYQTLSTYKSYRV